jgi:hypothetical protein
MKFQLVIYFLILLVPGLVTAQAAESTHAAETDLTPYQRVSMYLGHSLFKATPIKEQSEILWGIKGIKPVLEVAVNLESHFDKEKLENEITSVLRDNGVLIDKTNGYLLLFRVRGFFNDTATTEIYTYDLDLVDRVYVYRDGQLKSNFRSIWNISNMGYAGKQVYENAMLINVESAVEHFAKSYFEQIDRDILSETPKQAKQIYQKIRNGDANILQLLAHQELEEE